MSCGTLHGNVHSGLTRYHRGGSRRRRVVHGPQMEPGGRAHAERESRRPHQRSLRARRQAADRAYVRPWPATRHSLFERDSVDAGHRGPRRRQQRNLPRLGRVRGGRGQRRHHRAAGGPGGQDRRRLRAADGHLGSVHRRFRHGARPGRAGDARHPGGDLGAVSVRARRAALAVAARADPHRGGDGDHADRGHGDAHRLRYAQGCAAERSALVRAAERSGDRAGHDRTRAESHGSAPPLGTRHRRGGRFGGRRTVRHLRPGIGGRRRMDRRSGTWLAGLRSELRAGLLGAPAGIRVRDTGRRHRDDRGWRRHPARVLAAAAGGGLPCGAGCGFRGRSGQPAVRPERYRTRLIRPASR